MRWRGEVENAWKVDEGYNTIRAQTAVYQMITYNGWIEPVNYQLCIV